MKQKRRNIVHYKRGIHHGEYLKKNYPFKDVPKMTDYKFCIHCQKPIIVGMFKIETIGDMEFIVCPNAPECDGTVIDWFEIETEKAEKYFKNKKPTINKHKL